MKLRVVWWNTHLSPPNVKNDPTKEHKVEVALALRELINVQEVDFALLGEISPSAIEYLSLSSEDLDVHWISLEGREGRLVFNFALVFKPARIEVISAKFEFDVIAGAKSKIALRIIAKLPDGLLINIFAIHWTSRLRENEESQRRSHLAQSLRRRIDQILDDDDKSSIIVLGDFNDEPYDLSLSKYLMASRDIQRVAQRPRLLYNPFWKVLPPTAPYSRSSPDSSVRGSYFHRSGKVHQWCVFDQILFSASFMGRGDWHLDEPNTFVVDTSRGFPSDITDDGNIDHYPVLASIERFSDERL